MDGGRLARIVAALAQEGGPDPATYPTDVCTVAVELLGMTGAALTLMGEGEPAALWVSDPVAERIAEAQLTLGEGPGLDAFASGTPVLEPDLATASGRWPFFCPAALTLGVHALFALPIQIGATRLGVLDLFRTEPGFLTDDELADSLILADVATSDLLDLQALGEIPWGQSRTSGHTARVDQATGMVAAQLESSMASALAQLRAQAFLTGATIYDIADDVISLRLRFS
jgi:hypothetical protein